MNKAYFNVNKTQENRDAVIVRTSMIGIIANIALAAFKAIIGFTSHSVAILMDAVNNLSDAGSSIITIIGTKLAAKEPDAKHPWGYGRVEYLSAMLIAIIILYAGISSLIESIKKIFTPEIPDYSATALIIITVAVITKLVLGRYVQSTGKKVDSDALQNSGKDALNDAVISTATLVSAALNLLFHWQIEAYLAVGISLVIVKSGIDMLKDTLSQILGERIDPELSQQIKKTVASFPQVSGAYDLILNDYGPDTYSGSIHIEVPDTMTAAEIDSLIREIAAAVYSQYHVLLTGIGLYAYNTHDDASARLRDEVKALVLSNPHIKQMHGFYVDQDKKTMHFDLVIRFSEQNRRDIYQNVVKKVKEAYPDYEIGITPDIDFSD